MNLSSREGGESQFQIAPMLDIVFILLVFFVASYAVMEEERQLDVNLPRAGASQPERRTLNEVMVNLTADGECFVNRRKMSFDLLEKRLHRLAEFSKLPGSNSEPGVIIRADGRCAHKFVVQVMDICARAEIRRVFFSATAGEE